MTLQEELRLSQFRSELVTILGEVCSELTALRKEVRPARLFGEGRVEELMDLISDLIRQCEPNRPGIGELPKQTAATTAGRNNRA
jgi:hypothetical protein